VEARAVRASRPSVTVVSVSGAVAVQDAEKQKRGRKGLLWVRLVRICRDALSLRSVRIQLMEDATRGRRRV